MGTSTHRRTSGELFLTLLWQYSLCSHAILCQFWKNQSNNFHSRSKDFKSNYYQPGFSLSPLWQSLIDTRQPRCRQIHIIHWKFHLLTDVAEAPVLSDALIRLPEHWVKGLVAVSECRRGVTRDSEGSDVNLEETKSERSASVLQMLECTPTSIRVAANTAVNITVFTKFLTIRWYGSGVLLAVSNSSLYSSSSHSLCSRLTGSLRAAGMDTRAKSLPEEG